MGDTENMRVLFDQDGARISTDGFCVFPTDPVGEYGETLSLYFHIHPPEDKDFNIYILGVASDGNIDSYQVLPPSFLALLPYGSFTEEDALTEIRFTADDGMPNFEEEIRLVLSIGIGNDSYSLTVFFSTKDHVPVYLDSVSDDWPFPCYIYYPNPASASIN